MENLTAGGFNKLLTSSKRNRNAGLRYIKKALAVKDESEKERLTNIAGLHFEEARRIDTILTEYAKTHS